MPKAGKSTIELFRLTTWRRSVATAVRATLPLDVLAHLKSVPGDDMYADTMRYMEQAYEACGDYFDDDSRDRLCQAVISRFRRIRGYHGCRPVLFESYRRDGILVLTQERLAKMAFELFEGSIPLDSLIQRAAAADLKTRQGNLYFCASSEDLIEGCGHYLIYGAESLNCLWKTSDPNDVFRFHESQERARSKGIPTILICDVPIHWLPPDTRKGLANAMVTWHLQLVSDSPLESDAQDRNWSFAIQRDLPARYIRDHIHRQRIRDPLRYPATFNNTQTECDGCLPFKPRGKTNRRKSLGLRHVRSPAG